MDVDVDVERVWEIEGEGDGFGPVVLKRLSLSCSSSLDASGFAGSD